MTRDWSKMKPGRYSAAHLAGYIQALDDVALIVASKDYDAEAADPEYQLGHSSALDSVQEEVLDAIRVARRVFTKLGGD